MPPETGRQIVPAFVCLSPYSMSFCSSFMRCSAVFIPARIASAWSLTEERAASSSSRVADSLQDGQEPEKTEITR